MTDLPRRANQWVAQQMKSKDLIELTPEEVAESRRRTHAKLRAFMAERGFQIPEGEAELIAWLQKLFAERKE